MGIKLKQPSKGELSAERVDNMRDICELVIDTLKQRNPAYGESWKSHGGFSAFFNMQRKWSRVETSAGNHQFDLFEAIVADGSEDGLMDLIGYAVLTLDELFEIADGKLALKPATVEPDK